MGQDFLDRQYSHLLIETTHTDTRQVQLFETLRVTGRDPPNETNHPTFAPANEEEDVVLDEQRLPFALAQRSLDLSPRETAAYRRGYIDNSSVAVGFKHLLLIPLRSHWRRPEKIQNINKSYIMSRKSCPICMLYLLHEKRHNFLDIKCI